MSQPKIFRSRLFRWPTALLIIVVFFTAWDLWAIAMDQQLTLGQDCFLYPALNVARQMETSPGGLFKLFEWGAKGPFPPLLALLLSYLVGVAPLGGRLLSVLAHAMLLTQCFALGRRLTGQTSAGLWSAFLCGVTPILFGWARLEYPEMVLAVLVTGAIQLVLREDLERRLPAAGLGLVFALGIMTKVGFVAFMVVPGLWLLVRHLRARRPASLISLGLCLGVMGLVVGPWIALNFGAIFENLIGSTTTANLLLMDKITDYLNLYGVAPLLAVATIALCFLFFEGHARRGDLGLLGAYFVVSLVLFMGVFDNWSRYIVPIFPVAVVLVGAGLVRLGARVSRRQSLVMGALLGAAHLAWFLWLNLVFVPDAHPRRELAVGMMSPDQRSYGAFPRTVQTLLDKTGPTALLVFDSPETRGRLELADMHQLIWWFNGYKLQFTSLDGLKKSVPPGRPMGALLVRGSGDPLPFKRLAKNWVGGEEDAVHLSRESKEMERLTLLWLSRQPVKQLSSLNEHGDITMEAYLALPGPAR